MQSLHLKMRNLPRDSRSTGVRRDLLPADTVAVAALQAAEDDLERTVSAPRTRKARWMPWIISGALEWKRSGMKKAVARDADATPKLMAICCMVLAIVLAPLVCSSVTPA